MPEYTFPENFKWGAATAAYQIEGAVSEDGRGETIWDGFCRIPGRIRGGDTGAVACDHYHRFREDVALMRDLGLGTYRFSTAWSRIFPRGGGELNRRGLDFYQRLVDALVEAGIEPALTLYHWDLPLSLQEKGGWGNRDTAYYFTDYAAAMFEALGDRVGLWITHNEPIVAAFVGHAIGEHPPGEKDYSLALQVSHHLLLSHAGTVQIFREVQKPDSRIGITLNLYPVYPDGDSAEDEQAALRADGHKNRWFLDPVFLGSYPEDMRAIYQAMHGAPAAEPGDMDLLKGNPIDFLGVNYYSRSVVAAPEKPDRLYRSVKPRGTELTEMGWERYPDGLYDVLTRVHRDYGEPEMYVTENGAAFRDELREGRIEDDDRIDFLRSHFIQAHRALQEGVKLKGYFVWSLMDNFEWTHGYSKRFGLVHVDYKTQRRTLKQSARWYRDVIRENGFE